MRYLVHSTCDGQGCRNCLWSGLTSQVRIVAGNVQQAREWRKARRLDEREAPYVSEGGRALRGYRGDVVFVGTWYMRKDAEEMRTMAKYCAA